MSPRWIRLKRFHIHSGVLRIQSRQSRHASTAATATSFAPAPSIEPLTTSMPSMPRYPPTQPPSHKPPEFRKSQLHRQYTSLLRSTPMMLLFQHNNLKSVEWMGIRRELNEALRKCDEMHAANGGQEAPLADGIKINTVQTGIFAAALGVVEYFHPEQHPPTEAAFTHALSRAAHEAATKKKKVAHPLMSLLAGPLAVVIFPTVSPSHLKAALTILAPSPPAFPAPTRRGHPGYYDGAVQSGLQKLLFLGARIDGDVFDPPATRSVGVIEGGLPGLQAQLLAVLQGVGAGVTNTLEAAGRSLYFTVEGRRSMLEEELQPPKTQDETPPPTG